MDLLDPAILLPALAIALLAGVIKGLSGFAMPMILISGLSTFLPPQTALAGLILPTLVTNGMQALRQGPRAAWETMRRFAVFLVAGGILLVISAQLVAVLPPRALYLLIGVPITAFAVMLLAGWQPRLSAANRVVEALVGGFSGFVGGLSGVWGPPTVAYLTAIDTPKRDHVRIQGVIYGLGALALLGAHVQSGVVRAETMPFSVALLVPAILGMLMGQRVQDQIDQAQFKRVVLAVLLIAGLNLVRRGLT
ncbi:sulfite exporter TauE/SafE family protein [Wenxinia saemankumensis]|uniref:Probable membrane transporter protein n=1 Tax=Wenxinia saemankumensis TaxID=1447782 RepID=A0A1M6EHF5_9RHOB|nr:sulfite exporter TauE/SafE family protein [Wenxinia saemankumensis]SHI84829.1 hypothetical protein SAMN05444417_1998 [Wenxinia saemankumensis]